uniref:Uncharacterized protein n=1 Tax=Rhizophagus irregularis (strain DAOM 181602 / DAOM 197198 / MUCL 43194) TaxID=747089 RepID=U9SSE0_RHIID
MNCIRYFSGISSYSSNTEIEAWGYIGCLEYLAKVGVHLTLEDRDDILGRYRNHLHSIFSSTLTLKKAKDKAYKLNYAAERSFKRVEVTSFFKKLDTLRTAIWNGYFGFFKKPPFSKIKWIYRLDLKRCIDTNVTKSLANAIKNLVNVNLVISTKKFSYIEVD